MTIAGTIFWSIFVFNHVLLLFVGGSMARQGLLQVSDPYASAVHAHERSLAPSRARLRRRRA
jgi:hypothetical protein